MYEGVYTHLAESEQVQEALDFIESDDKNTLKQQIEIAQIPAPPFSEQKRAEYIVGCLKDLGLSDVTEDGEGNVYGIRKGRGDGPKLFVSAHIDSVFSAETDTTVTEKNGTYYGPGITDDARGLAALLTIVRALQTVNIETNGDIIFGGTVGEEGPGDLRGVKAFFEHEKEVDGFISIDAVSPTEIIYRGTGSFRYTVTFTGPGGHSFGSFGTPSAVHAAARAAAVIADVKPETDPKTTFNVGVIEGGTIPTAIAEQCKLHIDIRSNGKEELERMEQTVYRILDDSCNKENDKWGYSSSNGIRHTVSKVGNRPVGAQQETDPIVQTAFFATKSLDLQPTLSGPSSTDANYPISIEIPALTLGAGGEAGSAHSLAEWYRPVQSFLGPQRVLMTILGLVGTKEGKPLLPKRI